MKDPRGWKSTIPLVDTRTVKAETGDRRLTQPSLNIGPAHARGINAMAESMVTTLDENANERRQHYASIRKTDAYKIARAEAKRAKKRGSFAVQDASQDRAVVKINSSVPATNGVRLESGSTTVGLAHWQLHGINRLRGRK